MRKLSGMVLVIILALALVACGEEEDDAQPAAEDTEPSVSVESTEDPDTEEATDEPIESADTGVATPASSGTPASAATPAAIASPVAGASPAASPVAATPQSGSAAGVAGSDSSGTMLSLSGSVILPGAENDTFILTDSGCVGLGEHSDIQEGRQIIVRDESGAIIGVTMLEASDETGGCTWDFALDVPESEFYAVSIPMVTEHVFTSEEVEQDDGAIAISLS